MTTGRIQAFVAGAALGGCLVAVVSQRRLRRLTVKPKHALTPNIEPLDASDVDEDAWSVASSSSNSSDHPARGHSDKIDQSIINDLFGLTPAPVAERREHPGVSANEAHTGALAYACSELMASSDEDLADGGHDRYYGICDSDEDNGNAWCDCGRGLPSAVCHKDFVATRPCEVSVKAHDIVLIVHRDVGVAAANGSKTSIKITGPKSAREYWTVLKPPCMHHGIVPADVLLEAPSGNVASARSSSTSALRRADFFAACKSAIICGQQCSHEKIRCKVLQDTHGHSVQVGAVTANESLSIL